MGTPRSSSERMRVLFGAAKADGPSGASQAKIWGKVSSSLGATSGLGAGGAGTAKLLATGTLFGGTLTVGLAAALLVLRAAPVPNAGATTASTFASAHAFTSASATSPRVYPSAPHVEMPLSRSVPARARPNQDPLAREASLVADARAALARQAPQAALRVIRATRALAPRQLIPEELSVEAQALRALGRTQEAGAIEGVLRSRYPESALAR
jgi:hypothetical protein